MLIAQLGDLRWRNCSPGRGKGAPPVRGRWACSGLQGRGGKGVEQEGQPQEVGPAGSVREEGQADAKGPSGRHGPPARERGGVRSCSTCLALSPVKPYQPPCVPK